jgi:hypothetical protein
MRFAPKQPLPINTGISRLIFGFPGGVEMARELRAIVVHHTQGMYGVTFQDNDHGLFLWTEEVVEVDSYVPCVW